MLIPGWAPNLFPLLLDLDADRVAGNDGDLISTWANQSNLGTAADFTAATTARPTLKRNIMNGHSVLRGNGTANIMTSTWSRPEGALTWLMAFTYRRAFASVGVDQIMQLSGPSTADVFMLVNSGGYQPYSWKNKSNAGTTMCGIADTPDTNPHVLAVTYNNGTNTSVGSYTSLLDGVSKTVAISSTATRTNATATALFAFANGAGANFAQIDIARLLVFSGQLTAPQLAAADKYLRNVYGL